MKRQIWRDYFRRVWRWVRIPVAVVMTLYLCVTCIEQEFFYDPGFHTYFSRTTSPERGNFRAVYISKFCVGDYMDLVVLRRIDGRGPDTTVFVYEPTDEPGPEGRFHRPVLVWLSPNELEISLDRVCHIFSQIREWNGVRITYRIGSVDRP